MLLDIWGVPTTPLILLLFTIGLLVLILASRNEILNIFSGLQLAHGDLIKTGDYIKLESGEEGYVSDITWRNIQIKAPDDRIILVPNSKFTKLQLPLTESLLKRQLNHSVFIHGCI